MDGNAPDDAPPRRRLRREDRARQLIEVAEQIFAERGAAVTMDEIAERAGVTKPVLYQHFPSKDALVAACFASARQELFRVTSKAVMSATSTEEALWRTLRTFFGFVADRSRAWSLLSATGAVRGTPAEGEIQAMREAQSKITATLLAMALPGLEPRRARVMIQGIDGLSEQIARGFRDQPDIDLDQLTDDVIEALWLGGRALQAGERWKRSWS